MSSSAKTMKTFLEKGCDLVLDLETRGAKSLKKNYPGGIFVFILPPSLDELKKRLDRRGFENKSTIEERVNNALDEIREIIWYDYVIFNDRLETAIDTLKSIYVAEKSRKDRLANRIKDFLV